ncbi:acyltransferase family protein [Variovorax sp. M-6]|uniref:acyltransferase family protein n=1 Tax=Variovorax sp. M-6 TaxID=3233041 RepID=UPI003F9962E0
MGNRIFTLDYLRGLAALMVCICHFAPALSGTAADLAKHGAVGVQVFFVISGYIIPYSLLKGEYRITDIGRFWLKRLLRLQPTYAVALLFTFTLSLGAAMVKGEAPKISLLQLSQYLLYLDVPGENPVIWTLIVEMKYYLFISIFFPLLFSQRRLVRIVSFCVCAAVAAFGADRLDVVRHLPYFLMGFVACYVAILRIPMAEAAGLVLLAAAAAIPKSSYPELAAGLSCYLAIRYLPAMRLRVALFLGSISYSLYLIHFPLGVKLLNLVLPRTPESLHALWVPIGVVVCSAVAYVLFRLVEKPSSEWSQRLPISARRALQQRQLKPAART